MEVMGYTFPDDLYYDKYHFWAKVDGDVVTIGTTDLTQKLAGEITFVEVPQVGDELDQGKPFGSIESGKWVGRVYSLISGEVVQRNQELEDEPEIINEDPYGKGWICKVKAGNLEAELKNLMHGDAYKEWVGAEIAKDEE